MKNLIELTEEFAKRIVEIENKRKKIGELLREINSNTKLLLDQEVLEEKIIVSVSKAKLLEIKVAGVDGGLVKRSFHGIDLMLLRAIGVLFNYKDDKLEKVEYYPEAIPTPTAKMTFDPFSTLEFELNSNMERQIIEIKTARETIEKLNPAMIFLHGSIVPHYTEKPGKDSFLFPTYQRMIDSYKRLFEVAKEKGTIVAGIIEDSRGTRFCEIVNKNILSRAKAEITADIKPLLERTKDSNLLSYALELNERSFVFRYSSKPEDHPVLKEFGNELAYLIFSFYLKTAEFDRPIRIDFLGNKGIFKVANQLSSVLLALAGHSGYGIPSVLIEADQRAKLSKKDLELFYHDLINRTGNLASTFSLRREQRPF